MTRKIQTTIIAAYPISLECLVNLFIFRNHPSKQKNLGSKRFELSDESAEDISLRVYLSGEFVEIFDVVVVGSGV